MAKYDEFPLLKEQLKKDFGFLSIQLALLNVEIIGIRIKASFETVIITFRGAWKTGFIYEGGKLSAEMVFRIFSDVPEDRNLLEDYRKKFGDKVEILEPPKHNYVFINENEVAEVKIKKKS